MAYIRVYLREMRSQFGHILANKYYLFAMLIQPLLMATTLYYMFVQSGRRDLVPYIMVGPGILAFITAALYISGSDLIREREAGTMPYLIGSPTPLLAIVAGKMTADQLSSLFSFFLTLGYVVLLSGERLPAGRFAEVTVSLVSLNLSLLGLGLLMAGYLMLFQSARRMQNFLRVPLVMFSGIYFPVSLLPGPLAWPAQVLSIWWGAQALRDAFQPDLPGDWWLKIGTCLLLGGVYLLAGIYAFRVMEYRVRVEGRLEIGG